MEENRRSNNLFNHMEVDCAATVSINSGFNQIWQTKVGEI